MGEPYGWVVEERCWDESRQAYVWERVHGHDAEEIHTQDAAKSLAWELQELARDDGEVRGVFIMPLYHHATEREAWRWVVEERRDQGPWLPITPAYQVEDHAHLVAEYIRNTKNIQARVVPLYRGDPTDG